MVVSLKSEMCVGSGVRLHLALQTPLPDQGNGWLTVDTQLRPVVGNELASFVETIPMLGKGHHVGLTCQ